MQDGEVADSLIAQKGNDLATIMGGRIWSVEIDQGKAGSTISMCYTSNE